MSASHTHHPADATPTAKEVLAFCRHRWEVSGVAPEDIDDMLDELGVHLMEATSRGRRPADVVGPDLDGFACGWARARTPRRHRWLRQAGYVWVVLVAMTLLRHLIATATSVPVTPGWLVYLVGMFAIMLCWRPRNRILTFPRFFLATAILLVPAIAVDELLLPDVVVLNVSIWVTGSVAVLTAAGVWWDARRTSRRRAES